jgi:hypothetical protein
MGMSTNVIGIRSGNDSEYQKHSKVLRACLDAGIEKLPRETAEYFGEKYPYEGLFEEVLEVSIPKIRWDNRDMCEGYEIKVNDIPLGVETIRFYNSY